MDKITRHALKPDAQPFDEIRITTIPRFKTSGLSGDEWRISAKIEFMRKGKVVFEERMRNVKNAVNALPWFFMRAQDEGHAYFAGGENGTCDQEGCSEKATVFYRLRKEFCNKPHKHGGDEPKNEILIRQFCERHSSRGDSNFEDADDNYELLEGNQIPPKENDKSHSILGGIIELKKPI